MAGAAGLLFSQYPDWSNDLVRAQLEHTADSLDALNPGYEGLLGFGRVNAGSALSVTPTPLVEVVETAGERRPAGAAGAGRERHAGRSRWAMIGWVRWGVTGVLESSDAYVTITQDTADFGDLQPGGTATGSPVYTFDVALGAGYDHPIPFTLQVSANGGAYTAELDFTIQHALGGGAGGGHHRDEHHLDQ